MNNFIDQVTRTSVYDLANITPTEIFDEIDAKGNALYIKREDLQLGHSFKVRGAFSCISNLSVDRRDEGVVTASAGNHAIGVALACKYFQCPAYIFVPVSTPQIKIDTIKKIGATVYKTGADFESCKLIAMEYSIKKSFDFIHPYDDIQVILGQATVGLEVLNQIPNLNFLFVPIGGGGLAAGVSTYMKACAPQVKVIGVEPTGAAGMQYSLAHGAASAIDSVNTICDGVAVRMVGEICYHMCDLNLDDIITVDDADVYSTICEIHKKLRSLPEPSGALALAGARKYLQQHDLRDSVSVSVMTGANMDLAKLVDLSTRYSAHVPPQILSSSRTDVSYTIAV